MKLAPQQVDFMLANLELPEVLRGKLEALLAGTAVLTLEEADRLRDLCGERLQTHGFDHNYQPTREGAALEELIDSLFTG